MPHHLPRATPALILVLLAALASGACYRRADLYGGLPRSPDRGEQSAGAADTDVVTAPARPEPTSVAEEAVHDPVVWTYRTVREETRLPEVAREFRGVWVATVANMDWPSRRSLTTAQAQAELLRILDAARDLGLNAVIFQVRPMADAFYDSALEPWSDYLTGESGVAPSPYWDPLAFAIEEAHARGLELHAWFNPFRAGFVAKRTPMHPSHISRRRPDLLRTYGRHYWLDPGEPDARAHAIAVITDVVRRYDVDAVHIDDYFYPYQERDARNRLIQFPDEASWREHGVRTGLSRADWRRSNVDAFVERLYQAVRAEKRHVRVGISPFGIWRPGYPVSVRGLDAYSELFADTRKWLNNGWADYYAPQLYWRVAAPQQPYTDLLQWWSEQNTHGRHIWAGNHPNRVGDRTNDWDPEEILEQVRLTREHAGATGNVHFSASTLLRNPRGLGDAFRTYVYASPALVPASPWLSAEPPAPPRVDAVADPATASTVLALHAMPRAVSHWIVDVRRGDGWQTRLLPGASRRMALPWDDGVPPELIAVRVVDRAGVEGGATVLRLGAGAAVR
jgi:uncharacterized lipoprotein YddW (UPF0748 family)